MHGSRSGPRFPVIALTTLIVCGCSSPAEEVGGGRVDPAIAQALREGRPVRALLVLDEEPAVAAARQAAAAELRGGQAAAVLPALESAKARLVADAGPDGLRVLHPYARLPALHVELGSAGALERVLARPEVVRVAEDVAHEPLLAQSLPLIHHQAAVQGGATGLGTAVAVLDTGVDFSRPELGACAAAGDPGCRVAFARDFAPEDGQRDASGHGTNVAAIVAAVAPQTRILALDVFEGELAYTSDLLEAIDWCIANRATYGIVALNMSLGSGGAARPCQADPLAGAIRTARAAGILPVVAAGNSGRADRITSPACAPEAVSVGAVYDSDVGAVSYATCDDASSAADQVACFSGSASWLTILAPGAFVTAGGVTMVGTSQAAPHVAGAAALVRSARPSASADEVLALLRSGPVIVDHRNGVATPRLDLAAVPPVRCSAALSPSAVALDGAGGEATLEVTSPDFPCTWAASSSAVWLQVSPGAGGGPGTVTLTAPPNAGPPRQAVVTAGSTLVVVTQGTDWTIPTASFELPGASTASLSVTLAVAAGDDPTGIAAMCISSGPTCSAWQPFARTAAFTLAAGGAGDRTVYLWVRDGAGNVSPAAARAIRYAPAP